MIILVTGGAGFIGSNLCQYLLEKDENNQVFCLDNLSSGLRENIINFSRNFPEKFLEKFHFIEADVITYNFDELKV